MKTIYHAYEYDTRTEDGKAAWDALRAKLAGWPHQMHASGSYYQPDLDGRELELETTHLFSNQWNTAPVDGISDKGLRVFDWAIEADHRRPSIARGHWLEQTEEMREIRRNTNVCGYCGHQRAAAKGDVFCAECLGSEYLTEKDLHLLRMRPVEEFMPKREELTQAERAHLLPLYVEAQTHGTTARDKARIARERTNIEERFRATTKAAKDEHDGKLWLMDRGFTTDNVIYYSHTGRFCFGWQKPLEGEVLSRLLDVLSEFPFDYDLKRKA